MCIRDSGRPVLSSLKDIAKRQHHKRYISERNDSCADLTYEFSTKSLKATQLFDQARCYRAIYDKHLTHGVNRCKYKISNSQHCRLCGFHTDSQDHVVFSCMAEELKVVRLKAIMAIGAIPVSLTVEETCVGSIGSNAIELLLDCENANNIAKKWLGLWNTEEAGMIIRDAKLTEQQCNKARKLLLRIVGISSRAVIDMMSIKASLERNLKEEKEPMSSTDDNVTNRTATSQWLSLIHI